MRGPFRSNSVVSSSCSRLADVERHGRLADEEALRRARHAPEPRRLAERLELPQAIPLLVELSPTDGHYFVTIRNPGSRS